MTYPADLKYTSDHEWIQIDGATAPLEVSRRNLPGLRKLVRHL